MQLIFSANNNGVGSDCGLSGDNSHDDFIVISLQLEDAFSKQKRDEEKLRMEEERRKERERQEELKRKEQERILEV